MGHRLENEMEGLGSVMLEARDTGTRGGGGGAILVHGPRCWERGWKKGSDRRSW